ncbi:MAG: shikimate dehydrogenase [bacterium]|nr:shikimate dehydrogenase [bacterium]
MPRTRNMIDSETRLIALLGWPVTHSASPQFQNAALKVMSVNTLYLAFGVPPEQLGDALRGLRALGALGANCTIPHKEAAFALCDWCAPEARVIEAVNTVRFHEGRMLGYNTDCYGIAAALAEEGVGFHDARVVVLGAGGAARAIVAQAMLDGATHLTLVNRTVRRGEQLVLHLLEHCRQLDTQACTHPLPQCQVIGYDEIKPALADADILINATSVGMRAEDPLLFDATFLNPRTFVYDTIYNPPQTRLLIEAKQNGCAKTANGLGMLLHQGARALEIWFERAAPLELMRKELLQPRLLRRV